MSKVTELDEYFLGVRSKDSFILSQKIRECILEKHGMENRKYMPSPIEQGQTQKLAEVKEATGSEIGELS